MSRALTLGRIAGIRVAIHWTWLVLYVLMTWSLFSTLESDRRGLSLALCAIGALLVFASLVAHELAHALVARRFGVGTRSITLFLLGGAAMLEREPPTPRAEISIALAGPLASLALGGCAFGGDLFFARFSSEAAGAASDLCAILAASNLTIALFNLLPAFPMDGGRVVRAILWHFRKHCASATALASLTGLVSAAAFAAGGAYLLYAYQDWKYAWLPVMGAFVARSAWSGYREARLLEEIERLTPAVPAAALPIAGSPA
jgi:Zn-dependent protease